MEPIEKRMLASAVSLSYGQIKYKSLVAHLDVAFAKSFQMLAVDYLVIAKYVGLTCPNKMPCFKILPSLGGFENFDLPTGSSITAQLPVSRTLLHVYMYFVMTSSR